MGTANIRLKRAYEAAADDDGTRVLVDRIWPRGVSKDQAQLDFWLKDIAPSSELRTWWDHDPERLEAFADRYEQELSDDDHVEAVDELIRLVHDNERVTLLYAAKDERNNHAKILQDYIRRHS